MTAHQPINHGGVDVTATPSRVSFVSLILGILAVPGSLLTWDSSLPGEGFVWGAPVALAAVLVGFYAARSGSPNRWAAVTGIVLGGAMLLMMIAWTVAGLG